MTKERQAFLDAVGALNDEGFDYASWGIYQTSKTAGGFTDHEGWLRVREAAEQLPYIQEVQAKFDAAYAAEDAKPPIKVVPINDAPDIGSDVKGGGAV